MFLERRRSNFHSVGGFCVFNLLSKLSKFKSRDQVLERCLFDVTISVVTRDSVEDFCNF